jgi:CBS domain containing-hemolysin-like protein
VIGWIALGIGLVLAATGTVLAVGTAAVSRLELSRWVSQRQRGGELAAALLSSPGTVLGPAHALAAGGVVLAGLGAAVILGGMAPPLAGAAVLAGAPAVVVLCHTLPRAVGRRWAEPITRAAAPWLERAARFMAPVVPNVAGRDAGAARTVPPSAGTPSDEIAVIAGVIAFTERTIREVMTPRTAIVAVEETASVRDAALLFAESGYSRLPVFRDSLDQITGMVYVFDLLRAAEGDRLPVRPVLAAPTSRRCADLLFEMQRERRQLAVALDEFGGTAGMVTLEDLLEELVGEIFDETDAPAWAPATERDLLELDGATAVADVAARFGAPLPRGSETVSGLLASLVGRIPQTGERILVGHLEFDILRATPTRVERVLVRQAGTTPIIVGSNAWPG